MRRRVFIALVGAAAVWPLVARAQQPEGIRRIGVLMGYPEGDSEAQSYVAAFRDGLRALASVTTRRLRRRQPGFEGDVVT
jgi:putative tryptophan/tyrosine transport system substrate-binding protein